MTRLLSLTQAAAYLNTSVATFNRHVRPHVTNYSCNSRPSFDASDLDAWLNTKRVPPKSQVAAHGLN